MFKKLVISRTLKVNKYSGNIVIITELLEHEKW